MLPEISELPPQLSAGSISPWSRVVTEAASGCCLSWPLAMGYLNRIAEFHWSCLGVTALSLGSLAAERLPNIAACPCGLGAAGQLLASRPKSWVFPEIRGGLNSQFTVGHFLCERHQVKTFST